jgi:hypothetical protein
MIALTARWSVTFVRHSYLLSNYIQTFHQQAGYRFHCYRCLVHRLDPHIDRLCILPGSDTEVQYHVCCTGLYSYTAWGGTGHHDRNHQKILLDSHTRIWNSRLKWWNRISSSEANPLADKQIIDLTTSNTISPVTRKSSTHTAVLAVGEPARILFTVVTIIIINAGAHVTGWRRTVRRTWTSILTRSGIANLSLAENAYVSEKLITVMNSVVISHKPEWEQLY